MARAERHGSRGRTTPNPVLTVLMATKDRAAMLEEALDCYTRMAEPQGGWRLVVVDNGSADTTADVARRFTARLPLTYALEPRPGHLMAVNTGLDYATGDLVLFTDDDIRPPAHWLTSFATTAAAQPEFDLFGGPVRPRWPFEPPSWAVCDRRVRTVCFAETPASRVTGPSDSWLFGGNLAIRRAVMTPNRRFNTGWSAGALGWETELVETLFREGHKTWWIGEAAVEHMIRPEQLTRKWMLQRAIQFGRGRHLLDAEFGPPAARIAGIPRWQIRKALEQLWSVAAAWAGGDQRSLFVARWNLNVYRGAFGEAWRPAA